MSRRLKAQAGTDEANFGGSRFPVDMKGIVEVPDDAAAALVEGGGFVDITNGPTDDIVGRTEAVCKMRAPENSGSVSWNGVTFDVGADGVVSVPPAAASDLEAHGFALVED